MSMDRWNPFRDNFDTMRQAMDRWMEERMPGGFSNQSGNILSVAVDVRETERGYELEASLPGIRAEDIDIDVNRDTITLRGQSQSQDERHEGKNFIYRERRAGSFMRSIRLPEPVDPEKVEASLDHGVLKIVLPRLTQTQQRRVPVRSGQSMLGRTGSTSMASSGMNNSNQPQENAQLGQSGSPTPTASGNRQSTQNTGTSSESPTGSQPQSGAGSYGAGQTSNNGSQSQTTGTE